MNFDELKTYFNQHCRFKLKSGKEVYGVIWQVDGGGVSTRWYFASVMDHQIYLETQILPEFNGLELEQIVYAEKLVS